MTLYGLLGIAAGAAYVLAIAALAVILRRPWVYLFTLIAAILAVLSYVA